METTKIKKTNIIKKIKTILRVIIIGGTFFSILISMVYSCLLGYYLNIPTHNMMIYLILLLSNLFLFVDYIANLADGKVRIDD